MAICGIKVRMAGFDTAMNGARFQCCELPIPSTTILPNTTHPSNATSSLTSLSTEPTLTLNSTSSGKKGRRYRNENAWSKCELELL